MKTNLFDCKIGDRVIYTHTNIRGIIKSLDVCYVTITWLHNSYTNDQEVSKTNYLSNENWRHVYQYDNDKDLLVIKLKESDNV